MQLRVFHDPPAAGDWNMAVDEALLEDVAAGGEPALRFYGWSPATLSLGYFQRYEDRQLHPASLSCPCVRRQSGGGAILHDRELTYSLAVPASWPSARPAEELYRAVHQTLIDVLAEMGVAASFYDCEPSAACQPDNPASSRAEPPHCAAAASDCAFLCFQRRSEIDLLVGDAKIAGSAQRRRRGALLQHGSVLLAASPFAPELPGIAEAADHAVDAGSLAEPWCRRLADCLGFSPIAFEHNEALSRTAESLCAEKYAAASWSRRR